MTGLIPTTVIPATLVPTDLGPLGGTNRLPGPPPTGSPAFEVPSPTPEAQRAVPAPAAPTQEPSLVDAISRPFHTIDELRQRMYQFVERCRNQDLSTLPPEAQLRASIDQNAELMQFQIDMHEVAFQVELVSKVAEQGTSGARQVLQTQT